MKIINPKRNAGWSGEHIYDIPSRGRGHFICADTDQLAIAYAEKHFGGAWEVDRLIGERYLKPVENQKQVDC